MSLLVFALVYNISELSSFILNHRFLTRVGLEKIRILFKPVNLSSCLLHNIRLNDMIYFAQVCEGDLMNDLKFRKVSGDHIEYSNLCRELIAGEFMLCYIHLKDKSILNKLFINT